MNDNVVSRLTFELHVQYHIWCAVIHCVCITVVLIIYSVVFTRIKEMQLFVADRQSIVAGEWLTGAVIDAAQVLLKEHFPEMGGLQRTTLGH